MIIFLDVDGVLNCRKTWESSWADGLNTLDPELCDNFEELCKAIPDHKVVISSTWRLHQKDIGWWKLNEWLKERRVNVIGHTPFLSLIRGEEIKKWQIDNMAQNEPFIIIDDDDDFLDEQKPFHIQTSFKNGLTKELVQLAITIYQIMTIK